MNTFKKIFALVLVMALLFTAGCQTAFAQDDAQGETDRAEHLETMMQQAIDNGTLTEQKAGELTMYLEENKPERGDGEDKQRPERPQDGEGRGSKNGDQDGEHQGQQQGEGDGRKGGANGEENGERPQNGNGRGPGADGERPNPLDGAVEAGVITQSQADALMEIFEANRPQGQGKVRGGSQGEDNQA